MEKTFYKSIAPLKMNDKRGMGIGDIYPALLVVALVSILIGVVLFVLDEFADQIGNDTIAGNSTEDLMGEIVDFIPWIGIILLVIAAAIVLGLLINNLAGGKRV